MMRSAVLATGVLALASTLLAACASGDSPSDPDAPARRIVSLAPPYTETIFALGRGDRLVGRTSYCDTPAEARALPVVGDALQVNAEALVALRPDLVLTSSRSHVEALAPIGKRIRVRHVDNESVEAVLASIETLGRLTEAQSEAAALVASIRATIADSRRRHEGGRRPRVLFLVDRDPFHVASTSSYVGALLEIAGGDNVVDDREDAYPRLSAEALVARRPEVVIDASLAGDREAMRAFWSRFPDVPAVAADRIHVLAEHAVVRPGPRIPQAIAALERLLRPGGGK